MISFDDNSGGSTVNLNPVYLSLNALSEQQQTFESDLNNMMIDIQLISNSVSTLTGGGGAEYYITDSSANTDKLSFCYNLKDDVKESAFTDIYNNINMNGNSYSRNTIYNSQSVVKQFNLDGAGVITYNRFNSMGNCNINGYSALYNTFNDVAKISGNAYEFFKNSFYSNVVGFYKCRDFYSNTYSSCTKLNISANQITKNTFNTITFVNFNGDLAGNSITNVKLGKFQGENCSYNTFSNVNFASVDMVSIRYNTFYTIHNISFAGVNLKENTFGQVSTLNFDCNNMFSNSFTNIMSYLSGKAKSIYDNKITSDLSRMYLNGDNITNNTFANMTECNIDVLTLSTNNFATTSTIVIKMLNLTGESIVNNTFGECRLGDIKALTFNSNKITASDYLDFKVDVAEWNTMLVTKLNGIFDGRKNSISAKYGSICGVLSDNTITLNEAKIDGVLVGNAICGEVINSQTVGTITINHYSGVSDVYNEIYLFDEAHINGNRGRNVYSSIRRLYMDSLTPSDTFEDIQEIIYHGYSNAPASNFVRVGHIYSEVLSQMA